MYTGTLIDQLIATVERAETRAISQWSAEEKLVFFYNAAQSELAQLETSLAGVA